MIDDIGIFRTTVGVTSLSDPQQRVDVEHMMVDTGSEHASDSPCSTPAADRLRQQASFASATLPSGDGLLPCCCPELPVVHHPRP